MESGPQNSYINSFIFHNYEVFFLNNFDLKDFASISKHIAFKSAVATNILNWEDTTTLPLSPLDSSSHFSTFSVDNNFWSALKEYSMPVEILFASDIKKILLKMEPARVNPENWLSLLKKYEIPCLIRTFSDGYFLLALDTNSPTFSNYAQFKHNLSRRICNNSIKSEFMNRTADKKVELSETITAKFKSLLLDSYLELFKSSRELIVLTPKWHGDIICATTLSGSPWYQKEELLDDLEIIEFIFKPADKSMEVVKKKVAPIEMKGFFEELLYFPDEKRLSFSPFQIIIPLFILCLIAFSGIFPQIVIFKTRLFLFGMITIYLLSITMDLLLPGSKDLKDLPIFINREDSFFPTSSRIFYPGILDAEEKKDDKGR
ncbi:hypothetical protein ACFL35_03125 [Candidatus Riflebacteria bacterium]